MSTKIADSTISELEAFFLTRDGWQDWTPTVDQGGAVAVTVTFARYAVLGDTVHIRGELAVTGAGTGGNNIIIGGLPGALSPAYVTGDVGTFRVLDAGTAHYVGVLIIASATTFFGRAHNNGSPIGTTPSFALAAGDVIYFQGAWERG